MSRFSDEPLKTTLSGSERLAATDPSTGDDVGMTPLIIAQFVQANQTVATGSTQGVVTGPSGDKLLALPTNAQLVTEFNQLSEVAIPIFIGTPSTGFLSIYQHILDVPWQIALMASACGVGSTLLSIQKVASGSSAANIAGLTNIMAGTTTTISTASDTVANETLNYGDQLGISIGSTYGSAANFRCSIKAIAQTLL
jgi:hypothetical protein